MQAVAATGVTTMVCEDVLNVPNCPPGTVPKLIILIQ